MFQTRRSLNFCENFITYRCFNLLKVLPLRQGWDHDSGSTFCLRTSIYAGKCNLTKSSQEERNILSKLYSNKKCCVDSNVIIPDADGRKWVSSFE